jgi:hypothetical protein
VNLFPVEGQPFLTEVATYTVYTDVPDTRGGDTEPIDTEVTIKSDLGSPGTQLDNPDALYQVVAFKLHNPFNVTVRLSDNPTYGDSDEQTQLRYLNVTDAEFPALDRDPREYYYVEYLGRTYKLASLVEQTWVTAATEATLQGQTPPIPARGDDARLGQYYDGVAGKQYITLEGITIGPGETVVCYALSQSPRRILSRLNNAEPVPAPNTSRAAYIRSVIESQLADDSDISGVHWVPEINYTVADTSPEFGRANLPTDTVPADDLMEFRRVAAAAPGYTAPAAPTHEAVNLYRSVRIGLEADTDQAAPNLVGNPPVGWAFSTTYWDDQTPVPAARATLPPRNTRSNDQLVDRLKLPLGFSLDRVLPTPGGSNQLTITGTDSSDTSDQEGLTITTWAAVRRPGSVAEPRLGAFPEYCVEPKRWPAPGGVLIDWNVTDNDGKSLASLSRSDFEDGPGDFRGGAENQTVWRSSMLSETFPGDMAAAPNNIRSSPLGVLADPRINPVVPATGNFREENAAEVIVAAEDVSGRLRPADMLLPIGVAPMSVPLTSAAIPWTDATDPGALNRWTTLAEGMAMALGYDQRPATVPAIPSDILQLYYPQPNPDDGGVTQITPLDRGNLRLDAYVPFFDANPTAIRAFTASSDLRAGLEIPMALNVLDVFHTAGTQSDSLERGVPGLININTASTPVLRSLPMLSPPLVTAPNGTPWWWWTGAGAHNFSSDIAATVEAFRDKSTVLLRPGSAAAPGGIDFVFFNDQGGGITPDVSPELLNGRDSSTQISGIGEQPGFRSPGAILAARFRLPATTSFAWQGNIDYLGFDVDGSGVPVNNGREGVDSVLYRSGGGAWGPDALRNEYKERLTIANGVLSSITTRSDTFAVWFVVQGYRKSDVEGLTGNDPLVPSVQRRFLMILDRSNVKALGDKPRVLAFRELPI